MKFHLSIENKYFIKYFDIATIIACIIGLLLSRFFMSFGIGMMIGRILIVGQWQDKIKKIKENIVLLIICLSLYTLHLIGGLWSHNLDFFLYDINKKLPLLILPIAIVLISPIDKNTLKLYVFFYIGTIMFGTIWGSINYLCHDNIDFRNLIPSASHIRFSLNIAFASLLLIFIANKSYKKNKPLFYLYILIYLWFISYLFFTQSMTGLIILFLFFVIYTPYYLLKQKRRFITHSLLIIYLLAISSCFIYLYKEYMFYFTPNEVFSQQRKSITSEGNLYCDNRDTTFIENGNYISQYVCEKELKYEWEKRTGIDFYKEAKGGFSYAHLVIRYLNSKSPYKDGKSFRELSDKDIENIKNGVENVVYDDKFSIKPRLYKTFFEINSFKEHGQIKNLSIIQRIELWKNAFALLKDNLVIGVGTGDIADDFALELKQRNSPLQQSDMRVHNQYITFYLLFGCLGFIIFLLWLIYPAYKLKLFSNFLYVSFFFITCLSMVSEDTLDNMAGIMFFALINYIFIFNASIIKKLCNKTE